MADRPIPLLYNPVAGRGTAARRIIPVVAEFASARIPVRPVASKVAGDIEASVRRLSDDGEPRVLIAGGDGSVHEAVNGLLASNTPAALGVVPLGTGNDFAKANRIPLQADLAVAELATRLRQDSAPRLIDAGRCNTRFFANGVGIGFDARISRIAEDMRWRIGQLVYPLAVVRGLVSGVVTPRMLLEFDDEQVDAPLTLASFNIGRWVGGMFPIAPPAKNDDGLIDLVYVDALSRLQVLGLLPRLMLGTHLSRPAAHHRLITACTVRAESAIPAHFDGENQPLQRDFKVRILPGAISLL